MTSYNAYRQSGWGSTPERWRLGREVILEAVPHSGSFLDIGCANGLLLECLMLWAAERGVELIPYGIDVSSELVKLAQLRLPSFTQNFVAANCLYWQPEQQFTYVHTLLEYVPSELQPEYLGRLLKQVVDDRLIVSSYSNRRQNQQSIDVAMYLQQNGFCIAGSAEAVEADGWVLTRVAWIGRDEH